MLCRNKSLNGATVIIDGGGEPEIIDWLSTNPGVDPILKSMLSTVKEFVALLNTHAHFDHSGHIPDLKEKYQVPWHLHADDAF